MHWPCFSSPDLAFGGSAGVNRELSALGAAAVALDGQTAPQALSASLCAAQPIAAYSARMRSTTSLPRPLTARINPKRPVVRTRSGSYGAQRIAGTSDLFGRSTQRPAPH